MDKDTLVTITPKGVLAYLLETYLKGTPEAKAELQKVHDGLAEKLGNEWGIIAVDGRLTFVKMLPAPEEEVTHLSFFGENFKRLKSIFSRA